MNVSASGLLAHFKQNSLVCFVVPVPASTPLGSILDRRAKNVATIITSMPPPYSELTCGAYPIIPLGTLLLVNFEAIFQCLNRG